MLQKSAQFLLCSQNKPVKTVTWRWQTKNTVAPLFSMKLSRWNCLTRKKKGPSLAFWLQKSGGKNKRNILDTVVGTILSEALHSQQSDWKILKYIWRATWQILLLQWSKFHGWYWLLYLLLIDHFVMLLWQARIRSQNTTNTNSHRAFSQLKKRSLASILFEISQRPQDSQFWHVCWSTHSKSSYCKLLCEKTI